MKVAQGGSLALVFGLLPLVAAGQSKDFTFSGGVTLRADVDEMTDRMRCTVSIRGQHIHVKISNPDAVVIGAGYMVTRGAVLRVGDSAPFPLPSQNLHYEFVLPRKRSLEVTRGLFSGERIRVRLHDAIVGEVNLEIQPGDFRGAYNRARDVCGWSLPARTGLATKGSKNPPQ